MRNVVTILLLAGLLACGSCKKGDTCVQKFTGNWYGPVHLTGCIGAVSLAIKEGEQSCEVLLPKMPDGSSCGNSIYTATGTVTADTLFIASQAFGPDSVSGTGTILDNELTLRVSLNHGMAVVITGTKQ